MKKIFLCLYPIREFCYDYDRLLDEDEFDHCYKVLNECIEKRYRENGYQVVFAMYPEKNIFGVMPDATDKIITTFIWIQPIIDVLTAIMLHNNMSFTIGIIIRIAFYHLLVL